MCASLNVLLHAGGGGAHGSNVDGGVHGCGCVHVGVYIMVVGEGWGST